MDLLAVTILTTWVLTSLLAGLLLGALIRRGEQVHQDEFLNFLFELATREQASR
jgi:hypothetical protein